MKRNKWTDEAMSAGKELGDVVLAAPFVSSDSSCEANELFLDQWTTPGACFKTSITV